MPSPSLSDLLEDVVRRKLRGAELDGKADTFSACVRDEASRIVDQHGEAAAPLIIVAMVETLLERYERRGGPVHLADVTAHAAAVTSATLSLDFAMDRLREHLKEQGH